MLRALGPADSPASDAYRVPWHLDREDPAHPLLSNESAEPVEYVRVYVATAEHAPPDLESWGHVRPGETRELCLCACDLDETTVTIAWFRPSDAREWAWSFVI